MRIAHPGRPRRAAGFTMIGILLVIVIILVLMGVFFGKNPLDTTQEQVNTYQYSMDKATGVARGENLRVAQQKVDQWVLSHPDQRCTIQKLQAAGITVPSPPAGQKYVIENNKIKLVKAEESHPLSARGVPTSPGLP